MHTPVYIGITPAIKARNCINHTLWLLRSSTIVKIYQWLSVHLLSEDRKLFSDAGYFVCYYQISFSKNESTFSRRSSTSILLMTSCANELNNNFFPLSFPIPRAFR